MLVEFGNWDSHKLTSWVTAILLRDKLGYRTIMVQHVDPVNTFERLGIGSSNNKRSHINVEVWLEGKRPKMREWAHETGSVSPAGAIGYWGRSSWYVHDDKLERLAAGNVSTQLSCDSVPIVGWSSLYSQDAVDRLHIPRSEWLPYMVPCESDSARAAKGKTPAGCNFGDGTFKTPQYVAQQAQGFKCGTFLAATPEWDAGKLQEVSSNLRLALEIVWLGGTGYLVR